ncbi:MAG: alpha/beta hydrolase [Clostridiales bacterium 43-6]|nr:MAG: alpha/beta hydrolase [Clostridiales bacterium 43-6]
MAINKVMRAALKAITALEPDVQKSYKIERRLELITARLRGKPKEFKMWDHMVRFEDHAVPVRLFTPRGEGPFPLLLFFHGGGWVTGGIENYTGVCADLAQATHCTVASVDYRLAPEHKFPAALEDCYAAAHEFFLGKIPGISPNDITLIGDSAGGNLAAAVSLLARDRGTFLPKRQILLYPATYNDHSEGSPFYSIHENGKDYLLTAKRIQKVTELYQSSDEDKNNPYFAPLMATDFSRQPRTLVITAEYCPLRDEGEAFGEKLREAGNEVETVRMPDALHAYMMLPPRFLQVRQTYRIINGFLQRGNLHGEA